MDWTSGYVTDLDYTYGYYRELAPEMLRLMCLNAGVAPPGGEQLHYLELGFGQGLSINIHAAGNPGVYWGTDFNPQHAAQAGALAAAAGSGAVLLDDSFEELSRRGDLPAFDVIALHGIWTWVSANNRRTIVDIIRRHLKVGGLVYLSYNCFPGWAPAEPLRHLMNLHAELAGSDVTGTAGKVDGALAFAQQVAGSGALYFRANPAVGERLKRIAEQNRNYLAHEYFNRDWDLMAFSEVAQELADAKLSFVASAHFLDHFDAVNLSQDGQKLLAGIQHPILRQSVRDYLVNQQFRRDIFVKGPRRLTPLERHEALMAMSFALLTPPSDVPMKITGTAGEAVLTESAYRPVLEALADGAYAPKRLSEIAAHPAVKGLSVGSVVESVLVLAAMAHVAPARVPGKAARSRTRNLNDRLLARARSQSDIGSLASPVTGGGITANRIEQLTLLAMRAGQTSAGAQATFITTLLAGQGQRITKDGKGLESEQESLAYLTGLIEAFLAKRLPIFRALEIA
ncbi:MAG: class I SAM-dependent methyltransferase [Reyranellaceae bacterium]